ncbi:MAG TPA: translation initiation factor IF-2 [Methanomassiliicoccales archaeon]|nr:translation initiation factor IF-2 [Methanomassiliicoccales archaeon]
MSIRQPIVSVLGHVDHGKTKLLDYIRGTTVVQKEAGLITQHIGATEVPIDHIYDVCSALIKQRNFTVPGLLFIDTPGHHSFTTLRARGGALADLAILVIDVNEGLKPQTIESINILRRFKTPFVIALNKIDLIPGWRQHPGKPFSFSIKDQMDQVRTELDNRIYDLIGKFYSEGLSVDRYDRIENFTKNIAMVPVSAKTGEGIPELLLVLIGLAQRFLEEMLETEEGGPAKGTILELKEEKGLGPTLDVIIYSGKLKRGDQVALGTRGEPLLTKVKAILKPKPLDEIRDPRERFDQLKEVTAAAGIKISCQNVEGVVAGAPLMVIKGNKDRVLNEVMEETRVHIDTQDEGVLIKADAIGSLEALAYEAKNADIPIKKYELGDISRRDIVEFSSQRDGLHRTILGFNVNVLADAKEALQDFDVKIFLNDVVYRLIEEYEEWRDKERNKIESDKRSQFAFPGKIKILPGCVFRASKPAIVGVRVLAGRIRPGQTLVNREGKDIGRIKSLRSGEDPLREAVMGEEIAVAIEGATVGRQIDVEDILYVVVLESKVRELQAFDLNEDERMILEELIVIKRKVDSFWGM